MNFRVMSFLRLLIISSLLAPLAKAGSSSSVFFIDSGANQYLRTQSPNDVVQENPMLLSEVGATVSVLLGLAPSVRLSAAGSSKLNEVLKPNPFNRPHAVFVLEIGGVEDADVIANPHNAMVSSVPRHKVDTSDKANIQLPDREEVNVVNLDQLSTDDEKDITDKEISEFALLMSGSYDIATEELTVPLAGGARLKLKMSKKLERNLVAYLVSLMHNVRRAIETHEGLSEGSGSPAELLLGQFNGIKTLKEQYGPESFSQQQAELVLAAVSKIFDSLQTAYKGQIVGVIILRGPTASNSEKLLDVTFTSRPAPRWLAEEKVSNATIAEVLLVRRTLAWVTGILLIIATILGIHFLLNMPLTKDTLLYSNIKLD